MNLLSRKHLGKSASGRYCGHDRMVPLLARRFDRPEMSFQAVTWAIEQRAGSPSAKATLWSIANYANEDWCSWPSQSRISEDTEQSIDTVQRRLAEIAERKLFRRIPLKFAGRRAVDFFILPPSPLFDADLSDIEKRLPRGCVVDHKRLADDAYNTANCGNADGETLPQTIPQSAATVTAIARQQEPVKEPIEPERETRAREDSIPVKKFKLAWPTANTDSHAPIEREWAELSPHDQRAAIDGVDAYLAALARNGRKRIPSGATYLRERKWEGLPATGPAQQEFVTFSPWSREWWAWFLARIDRGEPVRVALEMAKQQGARPRCEKLTAMPAEAIITGLRPFPSDSAAMVSWRGWFEARGLRLPNWRTQIWVFLPGPEPPISGPALGLVEATGPPIAAE